MDVLLLGVLGGLTVLAAGISAVSIWFSTKNGSAHDLTARVSQLETQVTDTLDRLNEWQKRDKVRSARAAKESEVVKGGEQAQENTRTAGGKYASGPRRFNASGQAIGSYGGATGSDGANDSNGSGEQTGTSKADIKNELRRRIANGMGRTR